MNIETPSLRLPPGQSLFEATHRAMATTFRLVISSAGSRGARDAAVSAFRLIDELEGTLSRFRHGSDIHVLNHTPPGIPVKLGPDAWHCLKLADDMWRLTNGFCDVAVGSLIAWHQQHAGTLPPIQLQDRGGFRRLHLLPDYKAALRETEEVLVDLGALGKGYALDRAAAHLRDDWDVRTFLLECGTSSAVFATDDQATWSWPVALPAPGGKVDRVALAHGSLSGSAAELKPAHIINPHTGRILPPDRAAWAYAPSAAVSDALSTAFAIMPLADIGALCQERTDVASRILSDDHCVTFGKFPVRKEPSS